MDHGFVQAKVTGVKPLLSASYSLGKAQNQSSSRSPGAAEQIVGRERRERLSQLAWCGAGVPLIRAAASTQPFTRYFLEKRSKSFLTSHAKRCLISVGDNRFAHPLL
jgi:hypothetical protein